MRAAMRTAMSLALRIGLPLALGVAGTVAVAWRLALADLKGLGVQSDQQIRPTRGPVTYINIGGQPDGVKIIAFIADGRVLIKSECFGPEAPNYAGMPAWYYEPDHRPPEMVAPASIRALAFPWLHGHEWPPGGGIDRREIAASGWPCLALASERRLSNPSTPETRWAITLKGERSVSDALTQVDLAPRLLPLRPLWPGFLVDAACFSAPWALLINLPALLRRLRHRPGCCPRCGYDLRGLGPSIPCPECGQPAP